jgi:hypothetical protein
MSNILTGRQRDHLIVLSDGQLHKAYRLKRTSNSIFSALIRKGFAECVPTSPLKYRITETGKTALQQTPGA